MSCYYALLFASLNDVSDRDDVALAAWLSHGRLPTVIRIRATQNQGAACAPSKIIGFAIARHRFEATDELTAIVEAPPDDNRQRKPRVDLRAIHGLIFKTASLEYNHVPSTPYRGPVLFLRDDRD